MKIELLTEMRCYETENCEGTQERFAYGKRDDVEFARFKCNKCHKYIRYVNGKFYSMSKINNIDSLFC